MATRDDYLAQTAMQRFGMIPGFTEAHRLLKDEPATGLSSRGAPYAGKISDELTARSEPQIVAAGGAEEFIPPVEYADMTKAFDAADRLAMQNVLDPSGARALGDSLAQREAHQLYEYLARRFAAGATPIQILQAIAKVFGWHIGMLLEEQDHGRCFIDMVSIMEENRAAAQRDKVRAQEERDAATPVIFPIGVTELSVGDYVHLVDDPGTLYDSPENREANERWWREQEDFRKAAKAADDGSLATVNGLPRHTEGSGGTLTDLAGLPPGLYWFGSKRLTLSLFEKSAEGDWYRLGLGAGDDGRTLSWRRGAAEGQGNEVQAASAGQILRAELVFLGADKLPADAHLQLPRPRWGDLRAARDNLRHRLEGAEWDPEAATLSVAGLSIGLLEIEQRKLDVAWRRAIPDEPTHVAVPQPKPS